MITYPLSYVYAQNQLFRQEKNSLEKSVNRSLNAHSKKRYLLAAMRFPSKMQNQHMEKEFVSQSSSENVIANDDLLAAMRFPTTKQRLHIQKQSHVSQSSPKRTDQELYLPTAMRFPPKDTQHAKIHITR
eukprot:767136-Hanusia_phi.AAC.7